jgi:hypothetical protein
MGVDKADENIKAFEAGFAAGLAAAREEDFHYFDLPDNASGIAANANETEERCEGFPALTEEDLGHLSPGCFVQVGLGEASYWVEIGRIEGATISGMVHPELSSSLCLINHDSCEVARFDRDQITAMGCNRYCWC